MQIFNNEITCYVGETFTLNIHLVGKDGQPFVIPRYTDTSDNTLPSFFVFSVAPSVYNDDIYRIWVRIDDKSQFSNVDLGIRVPQFRYTNVVEVSSTAKVITENGVKYIWDDTDNDGTKDNIELYELTAYVFAYRDANSALHYAYFTSDTSDNTFVTAGIPYEAPDLQFAFTRDLTSKFGAQSYVYDLRFVACNELITDDSGNILHDDLDIQYKQIIVKPTKFKVLYPINETGGVNR